MSLVRLCCAFTRIFPKIVCFAFYLWATYTYCYQISYRHVGGLGGFLMFLVGLTLSVLGTYSYYLTYSIGAGTATTYPELEIQFATPDLQFSELNDEVVQQGLMNGDILPPPTYLLTHTYTVKSTGVFRYCSKCRIWKPDRCHHCSTCKQCILKMDHHCPWFATCIGSRNHKFFIQFLCYTSVFSMVCCATTFSILYKFVFEGEYLHAYFSINWILMFIFGAAFSIAVGAFSGFSIYQLATNKTTIETYDYLRYRVNLTEPVDSYYKFSNKPNSDTYGNVFRLPKWQENWQLVMGTDWKSWLLPIKVKAGSEYHERNGLTFPVNQAILDELQYNSRLQMQLASELTRYKQRRAD